MFELEEYIPDNCKNISIPFDEENVKLVLSGIILGDIVGSRYETREFPKEYDWKTYRLLERGHSFTDDSVLSVASLEAVRKMMGKKKGFPKALLSDKAAIKSFAVSYKKYAYLYPDCGFGGSFRGWAWDDEIRPPYESTGDGAAMRSGIIGAMFGRVDDVIRFAKNSAMPTHNSDEGIKGAIVTAVLVWMGLAGRSKGEMVKYAEKFYPPAEEPSRHFNPVYAALTTEELLESENQKNKKFTTNALNCDTAVCLAVMNFRDTDSYEMCLRNCLRYPSDADTVMAISGGFAVAYYKDITFQDEDGRDIVKQMTNGLIGDNLK